jgi:uncharacterized protein YegP (UPF0339 family)
VENETLYEDRRNRFLDHLLGRFAESFNEYVLMMYSINYKDKTAKALKAEKVIDNKTAFLKEYPVISYGRGTAFNYFPLTDTNVVDETRLWDTDNVSGLEKRSAKLSGIKNYYRRFLSCIKNIEIIAVKEKEVQADSTELIKTYYQFIIKNKNGDTLVQKDKHETREGVEKIVAELPGLLNDKANFLYDNPSDKIEIIDGDSKVVAVSTDTYSSKSKAEKAIKQFVKEFNEDCADAEGMLLIEHVLLRPRTNKYKLMTVCLDKDCEFCGEEDPYTFRASVFLPYWPDQFDSIGFRTYFEELVREEAPAHVMLKVCWINNTQMRQLEVAYKCWVRCMAAHAFDASADNIKKLKDANDDLVTILAQLHTVYPEATLHDCDESVNTNPVMLGKTILGTLKPKKNE